MKDLLKAAKQILSDWESVNENDPVPDEINVDEHWENLRAAITEAEKIADYRIKANRASMNAAQYMVLSRALENGALMSRGKIFDKVESMYGRKTASSLIPTGSLDDLTELLKSDARFERVGYRSAAKWRLVVG